MLMGLSASQRRPKAPIRENGIVVITMMENLGDSNWAAMTTNTRNTAMAMAWPREENSSFIISSMVFCCMETDAFKYFPMTSSRSFPFVERSASSVSWPEMVTWYCLSLFMMLWGLSLKPISAISVSATMLPVAVGRTMPWSLSMVSYWSSPYSTFTLKSFPLTFRVVASVPLSIA